MKIVAIGGGAAGLYFAILMKRADPRHQVTVIERNGPDDTFGFGVVFSDATLDNFLEADPITHTEITQAFAHWDNIDVHYQGEILTSRGHGFSGLGRQKLLSILQRRARSLGVTFAFSTEVTDPSVWSGADLVVAADGVNSWVRSHFAAQFEPQIDWRPNRFVWLGTTFPFPAFTFIFKATDIGLWRVHAYRYEEHSSTFILETTEETWRRAGLDKGFPNIKNHYNKLIRREITKNNCYCLNHFNADLRIEIFIDNNLNFKVKYKTKDIILLGRYNKYQRGLIQRFKIRDKNNNYHTDLKNFGSQLQKISTIEDTVLNFLYSQFCAESIKISWLGSEDKDSLVLGIGRPFIVRIVNPLYNIFKKEYEIQNKLFLKFQEIKYNDIYLYDKYRKIKTYVKVIEGTLESGDLENGIPNLIGETIFKIKRKVVKKSIYASNFKVIDNKNFELELVLDSGIPIKQLIGGQESISPCLSNLINKKCECVFFDIYDINFNCN